MTAAEIKVFTGKDWIWTTVAIISKRNRYLIEYALARFSSGKHYNADLNGSLNIAARFWASKLKLAYRNGRQLFRGKSPPDKRRIPVTLSTLWEHEAAYVREPRSGVED